jgi:chorismate mutase
MTDEQLEERLPEQRVQGDWTPEDRVPGERIPDDRVPEERVPENRVPENRVPENRVPDRTSEERVPQERVPDDRVPDDRDSAERLAGQLEGRVEGRWEEPVMERLVALRGATTVDEDTSDAVMSRTSELLSTLLERNGVGHDQLVSIIFTSTKDLRSAFPALAARELGLGDVPLLCAGELDVIGGNPNTIRVLVHCYSTVPRASLRHVYLHAAKNLRDDLPE